MACNKCGATKCDSGFTSWTEGAGILRRKKWQTFCNDCYRGKFLAQVAASPQATAKYVEIYGKMPLESSALLDLCARALEKTLRDEICDSWHYSDYGKYETYDDLPDSLKDAVIKAASAVIEITSNN